MRVFIDLHLAWLTGACFGLDGWCATTGLRIKQVDHVFKAVAVLTQQFTKLGLEFDFLLKANIAFESFESLKLLGEVFFELAKFCEFGHDRSLFGRWLTVYCNLQ
ncbi:hypothetical protein D3C76_1420000 [compost metagenome]